jgi:uncharacterized protein (TIGR00730 family)
MSDQMDQPPKAYKNMDFLNCPDARIIRILCEYIEPMRRFYMTGIKDTIVFFGSSLAPSREKLKQMLSREDLPESRRKKLLEMGKYREDAVELARRLTKWSMSLDNDHRFVLCSGGGPGIMEAANEGAALAGGKSIGLNISLPKEQSANSYITQELNFEFHYFFMRKFWFAYLAKALVIFPGGFGTMDELFEILTLIQTRKLQKDTAIIIYGTDYWKQVINFEKMLEWGTIREKDLDLFRFSDSPEEAYQHVTKYLKQHYLLNQPSQNELINRCLKHS